MSFDLVETSRFGGRPVELFAFRFGQNPGDVYAYTNAEEPITWQGITYRPVPIDRESIKADGTLDKSMNKITMPATLELPNLYLIYPPSRVVTLVIRQGHYDENDDMEFKVVGSGRVINVGFSGDEAEVGCESIVTSMRRTSLRRHYQYSCPHQLYGPDCKATKRQFPAIVEDLDNTILTVRAGWNTSGFAPKKFLGGMAEWESTYNVEPRTILRVLAENVFLLSGFLRELEIGDQVLLALGCAHDLRDCELVHANVQNFGGDPWIPFDNPFGKNPF